MKKIQVLAAVALVGSYVGYQEYRMNRMESAVQNVSQDVKVVKQEVAEVKNALVQAQPVSYTPEEAQCLAKNVFYEAGVEDTMGKVAVAQVTLNRRDTKRWGNDLCKVVYAHSQFSWTLFRKLRYGTPKGKLWKQSQEVAQRVLDGQRVSTLNGSLYYHTDYIDTPEWAEDQNRITQVGQHIFYTKAKFVLIKKRKAHGTTA